MTRPLPERFHQLLPAIYRQRDVEQGEPLRALLAVLEQEYERVRANVETTFDNWFIETCERSLVPYIGALVGVEGSHVEADEVGTRAFVANTIAYRRRRGTALMLEQLAQDITGYRVRAVEYFQRVQTAAHVQHVRDGSTLALSGTVDVRDAGRLERFGGPFDRQAHMADVRRAASGRGRWNLPNLGLHLWRIDSFEVTRSQAVAIPAAPNYFRFDPWGHDAPLYNLPRTETEISSLAEEVNLPLPLRRRELADDLERSVPLYLGDDPVFGVRIAVDGEIGPPLQPIIANLAGDPSTLLVECPEPGKVAVDPELGRLVLHQDDLDADGEVEVLVDYAFGSAGPLGAGPWDRSDELVRQLGDATVTWRHHVSRNATLIDELSAVPSLDDAISAWNDHVEGAGSGAVGMILLLGGRTDSIHPEIEPESRVWMAPSETIKLPAGARLYLVAAGVDVSDDESPNQPIARNTRAIIVGNLAVEGEGDEATTRPGGLWLNGVGLIGDLEVAAGKLEVLDLAHCTIAAPGKITIAGAAGETNAELELILHRSIVGSISATTTINSITAIDSLIGDGTTAIALAGAALAITRSTMLGTTLCRTAEASDCIFADTLTAQQHQQGCLRFCYVAPGGQIPRPFRCQPKLALEGVGDPLVKKAIERRIQPHHVASSFGAAGFALLHPQAPTELRTGAEDGSELGVFHHLQQARREARLRDALQRYLRFGLEAGLFTES